MISPSPHHRRTTVETLLRHAPLAAAALFAGFVVYYPLTNSDIWWHLTSAREMVRRGGFLFEDPFSWTSREGPWINIHWLFQLGAAAVHAIGGVKGLLIAKSLIFACSILLLLLASGQPRYPLPAGALVGVLAFQARFLVPVRPTLVSVLMIAAYVFCLERCHHRSRIRFVWLLVPLQAIWANCQGLFALGLAIAGAYWVEAAVGAVSASRRRTDAGPNRPAAVSRFRTLTFVLPGLALASCATPYGVAGALYPLSLLLRISRGTGSLYADNVSEEAPLLSLVTTEPHYVWGVFLVSVAALALFAANYRRFRIAHLLLFAGFLFLAVSAKRNVLLLYMVAGPILLHHLSEVGANTIRQRRLSRFRRPVGYALTVASVAALAIPASRHAAMLAYAGGRELSPFRYPVETARILKTHPVPGRMFNSIRFGGYLLWELYPPTQVFIDGRLIIRTPAFFKRYLAAVDNPALFPPLCREFGITHAVLMTAIFPRYLPLARSLYRDNSWSLVYADGAEALFVPDSLTEMPDLDLGSFAVVDSISEAVKAKAGDGGNGLGREAVTYLGRFLAAMGEHESSQRVLRTHGLNLSDAEHGRRIPSRTAGASRRRPQAEAEPSEGVGILSRMVSWQGVSYRERAVPFCRKTEIVYCNQYAALLNGPNREVIRRRK